jgi:hypothetical protein
VPLFSSTVELFVSVSVETLEDDESLFMQRCHHAQRLHSTFIGRTAPARQERVHGISPRSVRAETPVRSASKTRVNALMAGYAVSALMSSTRYGARRKAILPRRCQPGGTHPAASKRQIRCVIFESSPAT